MRRLTRLIRVRRLISLLSILLLRSFITALELAGNALAVLQMPLVFTAIFTICRFTSGDTPAMYHLR